MQNEKNKFFAIGNITAETNIHGHKKKAHAKFELDNFKSKPVLHIDLIKPNGSTKHINMNINKSRLDEMLQLPANPLSIEEKMLHDFPLVPAAHLPRDTLDVLLTKMKEDNQPVIPYSHPHNDVYIPQNGYPFFSPIPIQQPQQQQQQPQVAITIITKKHRPCPIVKKTRKHGHDKRQKAKKLHFQKNINDKKIHKKYRVTPKPLSPTSSSILESRIASLVGKDKSSNYFQPSALMRDITPLSSANSIISTAPVSKSPKTLRVKLNERRSYNV